MVALGGEAVSYERGTPVGCFGGLLLVSEATRHGEKEGRREREGEKEKEGYGERERGCTVRGRKPSQVLQSA